MADFFSQGGLDQTQRQGQNQTSTQTPQFGGNLSFFEQGFPSLYQPSGAESSILGQIQGLASQPRHTPQMSQGIESIQRLLGIPNDAAKKFAMSAWPQYFPTMENWDTAPFQLQYLKDNAIQATGGTGGAPELNQAMGVIQQLLAAGVDPGAIQSIQEMLQAAGRGPSSLETAGLDTLRGRTDSSALTSAAERYMREIAEPSARAASVAGGMGGVRGGAFQEGLAREGARMALPIAQMIQQAMGEFGSAQVGVGGGLEARKAGLAGLLEQMRQGQVRARELPWIVVDAVARLGVVVLPVALDTLDLAAIRQQPIERPRCRALRKRSAVTAAELGPLVLGQEIL